MGIRGEKFDCYRGAHLVLRNVSFTCEAGDCVILKGPNGSGKTTLLRTLANLSHQSTLNLIKGDLETVFLGHANGIKTQLTVTENCQFWADVFNQTLKKSLFDRLDLNDLTDRLAADLSAGQSRRLALARVFLSEAQIWLLDEPTNALDTKSAKAITNAIQDHCASGGITILSTHVPLDLPKARTVDVTQFKPSASNERSVDPFLSEEFK